MSRPLVLDTVGMHVLHNALANVAAEMALVMMKTSYSTIFNEGLDFSCAMFDRQGNMIGQAEYCPGQLAASIFIVRWTLDEIGLDSFEPGDVVLHNDPYRGGNHIPEHSVLRPVF